MADVWKSQGRKFCEICKVWFGDNRASIEFHERGKKHKDALAAKLRELSKKSRENEKAQAKMSSALAAMEAAALKAMRENGEGVQHGPALPATGLASKIFDPRQFKDVNSMARELAKRKNELQGIKRSAPPAPTPPMSGKYFRREPPIKVEYPELSIPEPKQEVEAVPSCSEAVWVEADSGDGSGSKYYFHMYTGEARWEQPESFYTMEEYQKRFLAADQGSLKTETHEETNAAVSSSIETEVEKVEPSVKVEPQELDNVALDIGDIPLPGAAPSEAQGNVVVKEEQKDEHHEENTEIQHDASQASSEQSAPVNEDVTQAPTETQDEEEEVEKPSVGPFGGWTRVKKEDKKPVFSPLTAKYRAEEERQRKEAEERERLAEKAEPKVEFTEKTSAVLTKKVKGPIEFKKRSATKNVRQRTQ
ncbi:U1 zinc finger [Ancylostoma ceylanicum]|uniref:U1 zinc finger n=2 Tax=Ancylostoma ceylanicum TaxID=53326 RepID=A0A8I3B187_9BILA|nr:U1 zinc finger [Ancylostoma ceylanicum]EYB99380.1 hypothetical protein Y032_0123g1173 [Ancylostoma ceylanicum]